MPHKGNKQTLLIGGGGGGGSGDVVGPASSTDNAIARFNGTTGKIIQNSSATIADDGTLSATSVSAGGSAFTSININGTGGNGHVHLKHQSADPTSQASSTTIFADSNGNPAWINNGLSKVTLDGDGITANRSYTLPDASGTLALTTDIVPGGADTQVQFNDGGAFGGDARFTFDKSTGGTTGGDFAVEAGASLDGNGAGFYAQGGRVGSGGLIQAYAGNGTGTDADGGNFEFISGSANGDGTGGNILFGVGNGLIKGKFLFRNGGGLYKGELDFESLTADRTITFQDSSGTVAYLSDITGGSFSVAEVEVDFGTKPVTSKKFTITNGSITTSSKIIVSPSGNTATGRVGNDAEWEQYTLSARPGTGTFELTVVSNGHLKGPRKFLYTYS